jgi:hypothetical protein
MSLVRLLRSGKTLVGLEDTPNSYRVTRQRLLPQFGPARNPFTSKVKSSDGPAQRPSPRDAGAEGDGGTRRAMPNSSRVAARLMAWRAKLSGWFGTARGKVLKPAIPRFPKPPVQGELSLDRVRVVRNDLSDADLEIVPVREPVTQSKPALAEGRWGRVTNRIFRAGKA